MLGFPGTAIFWSLPILQLLAPGHSGAEVRQDVAKKGGLAPEALWNGAALIIGGTLHDARAPQGAYCLATLWPKVTYRGAAPADGVTVRVFKPAPADGRAAVWFLRGSGEGLYTEEYPWIHLGPEVFLSWPRPTMNRVLNGLPHAVGESDWGARLFVIQAPTSALDPPTVWVALVLDEDRGDREESAQLPPCAKLGIRSEEEDLVESELQVPAVPQGRGADRRVYVLTATTPVFPEQIVVARPPFEKRYEILVEVQCETREPLRAVLWLENDAK